MKKYLFLSVISIFALSLSLFSQWELCNNGIEGGSIMDISISNNKIFIITHRAGVFVSDNNAENWKEIVQEIPNKEGYAVLANDSCLFTSYYGVGLIISRDEGKTWSVEHQGLNSKYIWCLHQYGKRIYAGTDNGLYLTSDNGRNWSKLTESINTGSVYSIAVSEDNIYLGCYNGVFISYDSGKNWNVSPAIFNGKYILSIANKDDIIIAGYMGKGLFISTDKGDTWQLHDNGLKNQSCNALLFKGDSILAGTDSGIYFSIDSGKTWSLFGLDNNWIDCFAFDNTNILVGSVYRGFYLSNDLGNTWLKKNKGIINFGVNCFTSLDNTLISGSYGSGVFMTTDYGNNWNMKSINLSKSGVNSIKANGNNIFVSTSDNGFLLSTDLGETWIKKNNTLPDTNLRCIENIGNLLFIGTLRTGIFFSSDLGDTWEPRNIGLMSMGITISDIKAVKNKIYATSNNGLFVSYDFGNSWTPLSNKAISTIDVYEDTLIAGTYFGSILKSTDGGQNWQTKLDFSDFSTINSIKRKGNILFAATYDYGIYYSSDSGENWIPVSNDIEVKYFSDVYFLGDYVFICGSGVYRALLKDFETNSVEFQKMDFVDININPNPASDFIEIAAMNIEMEETDASIKIFNSLGMLVKKQAIANNSRNTRIDISELNVGVYYCVYNGNKTRVSKNFVIVR